MEWKPHHHHPRTQAWRCNKHHTSSTAPSLQTVVTRVVRPERLISLGLSRPTRGRLQAPSSTHTHTPLEDFGVRGRDWTRPTSSSLLFLLQPPHLTTPRAHPASQPAPSFQMMMMMMTRVVWSVSSRSTTAAVVVQASSWKKLRSR